MRRSRGGEEEKEKEKEKKEDPSNDGGGKERKSHRQKSPKHMDFDKPHSLNHTTGSKTRKTQQKRPRAVAPRRVRPCGQTAKKAALARDVY